MNHVHHQLMHVRIMLMHLIHAYIESIVILASWCMHHWASIVAIAVCHASFRSCMEHLILVLHHHCNHTFHGYIVIMAIEHLHSKLEYFATIP